ncbi:hypothetical protein ACFFHH_04680 [Cytobacillus solani]|uniref:hypothetical protein n=1 Tax=Cytobacillus solani TaxID=1637975 RepID=UPI00114E54A9|nr:hypothetical protein [Cytobacillus solani]
MENLNHLSKKRLQLWQIAKVNLRHNFLPHFLLCILLLLLTPVLFGISSLDNRAAAVPLEIFISLTGILLLTPIFQPEQDSTIDEITSSKYISNTVVYLIRIAYSILTLIMLISIFSLFMKVSASDMTLPLYLGAVVTAMFLGSIGLFTASIFRNIAVSYMVPIVYYALNFGGDLGNFYLFSMMGGEFKPKIWLFAGSLMFIILSIYAKWISSGHFKAIIMKKFHR